MSKSDRTDAERRTLWLVLAAVSVALGWILLPFYGPILWAAIIALLSLPMSQYLLARMPGRRSLAAALTLLVVLVIVILPFALTVVALVREAVDVVERLRSGELNPERFFAGVFAALPDWIAALLQRLGLADFAALQRRLSAALVQGGQIITMQALSWGQNTFDLAVSLCITLYLAYFLIRDGEQIVGTLQRAIPLDAADKRDLGHKFRTVIRATVKGNLLVAAIQGALGGLAFWALDVNGALLLAVVMAMASLVPAVGAALVWVPVAAWFFLSGDLWHGVALVAWGMLVIGLIDNLLRPLLVGKDTRMPDFVVLISTLGGMAVFGLNGFVLGPLIAAMFIAVWHIALPPPPDDAPPDAPP